MNVEDVVTAAGGGVLIGLAAVLLMATAGRIAGIAGLLGGLLGAARGDRGWRLAFLAGLIAGPLVVATVTGRVPSITVDAPLPMVITGGLLVGFGTRLGNGCTSGHGVCGLARGSKRSFAATLTFMATAIAVVYLVRHGLGG